MHMLDRNESVPQPKQRGSAFCLGVRAKIPAAEDGRTLYSLKNTEKSSFRLTEWKIPACLGSVAALEGVEAHAHHVYKCAGSLINSSEGP